MQPANHRAVGGGTVGGCSGAWATELHLCNLLALAGARYVIVISCSCSRGTRRRKCLTNLHVMAASLFVLDRRHLGRQWGLYRGEVGSGVARSIFQNGHRCHGCWQTVSDAFFCIFCSFCNLQLSIASIRGIAPSSFTSLRHSTHFTIRGVRILFWIFLFLAHGVCAGLVIICMQIFGKHFECKWAKSEECTSICPD